MSRRRGGSECYPVRAERSLFRHHLKPEFSHFARRSVERKVPRHGTAQHRCVTRMSTAGVIFPTGDLLAMACRHRELCRGPSHFCSPLRVNKSSSPRSTGVSGLSFVSSVGSLRPKKHMFVLATPWRCGRCKEFDNRSSSDQGQRDIQHCHHTSELAHPVPPRAVPFPPLRGSSSLSIFRRVCAVAGQS